MNWPADKKSILTVGVPGTGYSFFKEPTSGYLRGVLLNLALGRLAFPESSQERYGSLLSKVPIHDNSTVWTFTLREDLVFHDGEKVTISITETRWPEVLNCGDISQM